MCLSETQYGFRNDLDIRDALFCRQVLVQRFMDMNRDMHVAYIYYEKPFDQVKLVYVLKKL